MKIVFMGTPDIAASCLRTLYNAGFEILLAVTREDKPKGRGESLAKPPVKIVAEEYGIPVYQPKTLRTDEAAETIRACAPDAIVVVAYGRILPKEILDIPKYGCVNLHVSLLPAYRGAAPIERAVMNGEKTTGVTAMRMDEGLDTGDIYETVEFPIGDRDTAGSIREKSAEVGGPLLVRTLHALEDGTAVPKKQAENGATYAAKIEKEDCLLDFSLPARVLDARIRGLLPIPTAYTHTPDGKTLKILDAVPTDGYGEPGTVIAVSDKGQGGITVACGEGALLLRVLKPEGKGAMTAGDLVRGRKIKEKEILF